MANQRIARGPKQQGRPPKKRGRLYEEAVCDLWRQLLPSSTISPGVWVVGPDGRREMDVAISTSQGDKVVRGMVECKDFNPATTGPVGVEYIDALDSKRRDLGLDFAYICSNAGFTSVASSKAKRVDIGLLAATSTKDQRIRFSVVDEYYIRHIGIEFLKLRFTPVHDSSSLSLNVSPDLFTFEGRPVLPWFCVRFLHMLALNPIVRGDFYDSCRLKTPVRFDFSGQSILANQIGMEARLRGAWFKQKAQIDSSAGIYDWLRGRILLAPSTQDRHLEIGSIDPYGGEWIESPPDLSTRGSPYAEHEVDLKLLVMDPLPTENAAELDIHVVQEDLDLSHLELTPEAYKSVPGVLPVKRIDTAK